MDRNGCSQQSKMQLPRARFRNENTDDRQRDKEEPHRSVTIAATCSYRMDRHYVVRKPLFPAEQHMSTLKMAHSPKVTEKENHGGRSNDFDTREALAPDKCNLSFCDISASPKIKHPSLCLSATGLQAQSCWGKSNSRSPFHDRKSAQSGLPSSFLQVQKVHFPLRPPLTSPVLSPTCNPCLGNSKADQTKVRQCGIGLSDWEETKMCSPGTGEDSLASPHQANYWACAIPKAMPPILNRNSADWNPKMDYQALLDYTYPLKPGHMDSDWDSSKQNQDFLPKTFPSLQDSGIELDQLGSSTSSSGQDFSVSDVGQRSPDPRLFPRFSDASASSFMPSPAGSVNAFLGAVDCCTDTGEENNHRNYANHHRLNVNSASPGAFTRKVDDEFWLLPEQLEVSGHLCRQVRDLTAELSRPASCESIEPTLVSSTFLQKQEDQNYDEDSKTTKLIENVQDLSDLMKSREQKITFQTAGDHREENSSKNSFDRKGDPAGERLKESRLAEVENLVVQLRSTDLSDCQRNNQVDQEDHHTLMKHIQVFCSHLELLIQQLYAVSQRVEQFSAPTVDLNSLRSSLAEYQSFQKELSNHQHLTSSVLHSGQQFLNCINATSPFLRDTLLLIEKQSGLLQTQSDHFFSSIMSAVDGLTQPSPMKEKRE